MFSMPTDVLPKSLAFGVMLWATASYFVIGPEVGARVAKFDHLQVCQSGHTELVKREAESEMQALAPPTTENDIALGYVGDLMNAPMMRELAEIGGWGGAMGNMTSQLREKQAAAKENYARGRAEIEARTRRKLADSEGFCGCVADAAIDKSRNDWALFAGSLGLFSNSKVENFGEAFTNPDNIKACAGTVKGDA